MFSKTVSICHPVPTAALFYGFQEKLEKSVDFKGAAMSKNVLRPKKVHRNMYKILTSKILAPIDV